MPAPPAISLDFPMIKVLHVDDEADILEITKMSLELSDDFDLVSCLSGSEGLLSVRHFRPDVFLLDVMMPGLTGIETLVQLRALPGFECIPAVFMTARFGESSKAELLALGATEVINKPFDPITLGADIKAAFARQVLKCN